MPVDGGIAEGYAVIAAVHALASIFNGEKSRKQQKELAEQNQQFQERLEQNRQDFQLQRHLENAKLQRELNEQNHRQRLEEQRINFENTLKSAEWRELVEKWPLNILPSALRNEIMNSETVALQIFFTKSNNENFSKFIYPTVEQGIREFVQRYKNEFNSCNINFYHNAYKENFYGGAFNVNIRYAMRNIPVLIIDLNVPLLNELYITATLWGFDDNSTYEKTIFHLPYDLKKSDGFLNINVLKPIADEILAHLKFVIGYIYDMYNLITYNQSPILPKVTKYEYEQNLSGNLLEYEDLKQQLSIHYNCIYSSILGLNEENTNPAILEIPEVNKINLHNLRLDYALSVKENVKPEEYLKYLDESIKSWCELRTKCPVTEFLLSFRDNRNKIMHYFSDEDIKYFQNLCSAYKELYNEHQISSEIGEICTDMENCIVTLFESASTISGER